MATGDALSVVLPSFREGDRLIASVRAARAVLGDAQLVVSAHDEPAAVRDAARAEGATWVEVDEPNRGLQLRRGAEQAQGGTLAFLHADTRLPEDAAPLVRAAVATPGVAGGAFRLRFDTRHPVLDALARLSAVRWTTSFMGDQCLFCSREAYDAAGGFQTQPLFEDVDFARRLARVGRLVRLPGAVTTSARRFVERGPLRQAATNAALLAAFHAGVSCGRLASVYAARRPHPPRA